MTDKLASRALNGGGVGGDVAAVGGANASQPPDVMDSWKRVAQINMKALERVSVQGGGDLFFFKQATH